jgi:hypothetical protein
VISSPKIENILNKEASNMCNKMSDLEAACLRADKNNSISPPIHNREEPKEVYSPPPPAKKGVRKKHKYQIHIRKLLGIEERQIVSKGKGLCNKKKKTVCHCGASSRVADPDHFGRIRILALPNDPISTALLCVKATLVISVA